MPTRAIRFKVFTRDHFTCQYCGRVAPDVTLEVDHVIPKSSRGSNRLENLVTACFDCNRGKHARILPRKIAPIPDWAKSCGDWCPDCPPELISIRPTLVEHIVGDAFHMRYRGLCGHEWETFWDASAAKAHAEAAIAEGVRFWPHES